VPVGIKEETKFEKGKIVVTDQSEMHINITSPRPQFNLGVGWSKNGAALQANGPVYKNVSWWMYGDKKTLAGGIQFPIMK
jgi:acyl-homoserine lactone acylase PvdQ